MRPYQELMDEFRSNYSYSSIEVDGAKFNYLLVGSGSKTLVLLNGGMNISSMWMSYIEKASEKYQVLSFDYPRELTNDRDLIEGMHKFFNKLGLTNIVLVGASFGGYVAEMYARKYQDNVVSMILLSTGGLDKKTIKSYQLKRYIMPVVIWYLKRCNYDKFKKKMVKFATSQASSETAELKEYAKSMFEVLFSDYTKEKDIHITTLLNDLFTQEAVTREDFKYLKEHILLILPTEDFFSKKDQANLISLMNNPVFKYVKGGHLSTLLRSEEYLECINEFLEEF